MIYHATFSKHEWHILIPDILFSVIWLARTLERQIENQRALWQYN